MLEAGVKGHKEIVKVADGGPYLKTKGILA